MLWHDDRWWSIETLEVYQTTSVFGEIYCNWDLGNSLVMEKEKIGVT